MTDQQEKVIDKLKKIKAMADGAAAIGSEAEAQAFAEMLQRMLLAHKLEMTDIEFAKMEQDEPVIQRDMVYPPNPEAARQYGNVRKTRVAWMERLAGVIARAHFCSIVVYKGTSRLALIGRPDDIMVAEYMIIVLQRAADRLGYLAKQTYKKELADAGKSVDLAKGFRESWVTAFTARLADRYEAERRAQTGQSTALVRVNKADAAVKDFIRQQRERGRLGKSSSLQGRAAHHHVGHERGRAAADAVDLRANGLKSGNTAAPKRIS